jgi:hypothetical protein
MFALKERQNAAGSRSLAAPNLMPLQGKSPFDHKPRAKAG